MSGTNHPGSNYLGGNFPRGQLSGGQASSVAIIRGTIIRGAIIQGAIVWGQLYGRQFSSAETVIHILLNISKNKDNKTMKFSQLIEYNMRNIILEKSYTKCSGETSARSVSGKLKLSISLNHISEHISGSEVLYSLFLFYPKLRAIELY